MRNDYYIYCLFRPDTFRPCYIGKGSGVRWKCHDWSGEKHKNRHLARIYKKAGGASLPCVIMHEDLDEDTAFQYEIALIAAIGRADKRRGPLANQTDGGEGPAGYIQTALHRSRISKGKSGIDTVSPEGRAEIKRKLTGRKASKETCEKRSLAMKGRAQRPEVVAARAENLRGKKRSGQALENIRKGRRLSPEKEAERIRKQRETTLGRKPSAQTRANQQAGIDAYWAKRISASAQLTLQFPVLPARDIG